MCLCMFMAKHAVGVQLGDDMAQGGVDGQEPVQEHQDTLQCWGRWGQITGTSYTCGGCWQLMERHC